MMLKITIQQRRKNASAPWQQRISALVANTVAKQSNGEFEVCRPRTLFSRSCDKIKEDRPGGSALRLMLGRMALED